MTTPERVSVSTVGPGSISIQITPDRAAEGWNRTLAEAGVYASEISTGNDLEELFLTLTAASTSVRIRTGRFASIDPSARKSATEVQS